MILGISNYRTDWMRGGNVSFLLVALLIWDVVWKGKGLWRAAQKKHGWWFVAILILNTAGILPIVYLKWFAEKKGKGKK